MPIKSIKKVKRDKIKFGTDGWRAVIGDTFTFENLEVISQATVDYLKSDKKNKNKRLKIIVGYDTRFLSERFAQTVACVFAANGIKVILCDGDAPTPAISFAVRKKKMDLGIVITASHNPPEFNGFKIKDSTGGSADIKITNGVEGLLFKRKPKVISLKDGLEKKLIVKENIISDYTKFLRSYLNLSKLKNGKFKILVDCMYGSGKDYIKQILSDTAVDVEIMRNERNTYFDGMGPEPVKKNLSKIISRMKSEDFDLGVVLDGDADRIAAISKGGKFIHPQEILGLLVLHLKEDRGLSGGVVKTIAGTTMIDHICDYLGLKLYETKVGFKYISKLMEEEDILAGGEEAGGMGFKNYIPERDGTLAGLLLLEMMVYRNEPIGKIVSKMQDKFGRYIYLREDLELKPGLRFKNVNTIRPKKLLNSRIIRINDLDGIKLICEDESWLMLRPSGTEALMRIYSGAKSFERAKRLLNLGEKLVRSN